MQLLSYPGVVQTLLPKALTKRLELGEVVAFEAKHRRIVDDVVGIIR
jgi:hypothetical protein